MYKFFLFIYLYFINTKRYVAVLSCYPPNEVVSSLSWRVKSKWFRRYVQLESSQGAKYAAGTRWINCLCKQCPKLQSVGRLCFIPDGACFWPANEETKPSETPVLTKAMQPWKQLINIHESYVTSPSWYLRSHRLRFHFSNFSFLFFF